jgi:hypothetical protein
MSCLVFDTHHHTAFSLQALPVSISLRSPAFRWPTFCCFGPLLWLHLSAPLSCLPKWTTSCRNEVTRLLEKQKKKKKKQDLKIKKKQKKYKQKKEEKNVDK